MLLLVRHGVTEANREGRYLGRTDLPLAQEGRQQVARLARWLPPADVVVTSPLRRTRETAAALGAPVEVDDRWIELDYGPLELEPVGSVAGDIFERWVTDPQFAPPGVETFAGLSQRVWSACDDLVERAASSVVVVVTHVSPIKAAVGWALNTAAPLAGRMFVEDAGVSRIDIVGGRPTVRWFNRLGDAGPLADRSSHRPE